MHTFFRTLSLVLLFLIVGSSFAKSIEAFAYKTHAVIYSENKAKITSPIDALVKTVHVSEGHHFKAGDVLIEFDCTVIEADKNKALAQMKEKESVYHSSKRLFRLGGIKKQEVESNLYQFQQAKANYQSAAYYYQYCKFKAPFSGQMVKLYVHPHEQVKRGDDLFKIINQQKLLLRFYVPSSWLKWLKTGAIGKVYIDETKAYYEVKVSRIVFAIDAVSRTTMVIATLKENQSGLYPGMSGEIFFKGPQHE